MGSASRSSITASKAALVALGAKANLALGEQLFTAGRAFGESAQLRGVVTDPAVDSASKIALLGKVFGKGLDVTGTKLLGQVVAERWSSEDDLLAGIEELAIRSVANSAAKTVSIQSELFAFARAVSSDNDLELALGSKLGNPAAKAALVAKLLKGKASAQTIAIVSALVQQPRGRRIGTLLSDAADIVADQAGQSIATVTSAQPLAAAQLTSLAKSLAKVYGRELSINLVIDPSIIGGLRVQVGDDVIDGTVSSRIADLRLQLAG
jgi:F-type H+-transporting ATPase subunit delta